MGLLAEVDVPALVSFDDHRAVARDANVPADRWELSKDSMRLERQREDLR